MENKTSTAYLPEYKVTVPMAEGETADQLRYKYNIAGLGKSRNNFIGMQEYEGPTAQDVKSVLFEKSPEQKTIETLNREPVKIERPIEGESVAFDNKDNSLMTKAADEKQTEKMIEALQPKQEEYRKKTLDELGQEKINNLVLRPEEPKQTNYVSSFLKGFANAPLNMAFDIYSGLDALGVDLGNKVAEWKTGEKIDIEQEKIQRIVNLRNSQSAVVSALGLDLKKNDSELFFDGGSALSSLFLSFGIAGITKSAAAMTAVIGMSAGGGNYAVLREKGVAPLESFKVAAGTGFVEGALEKWGFHNLLEAYTVKLGKGTALRQFGKAFAVEGTQEASQSLAGNFLMAPYEKGYQGKDWIKQAAYEGMLGGLAGIAGGGVALSVTQKTRAKYASIFEKEMNMTPETARALAEQVVLEPEQAQKVIEEIVDNETLSNLENKNLVDDALKNKAEAEDLLSEILEQKALGLSDEVEAKSDEFAESIKQQAIKAGDSEENAEAAAVLTKNLVRNIAQTRIEQGVDADTAISDLIDDVQSAGSAVEDLDPNIVGGGKKFVEVEEERPELTDEQRRRELQEERIDIMTGEGMNEDEARFRVMTGKEPDDLDRKLGFDFIPYQLGEALTERENGYKIADDNETVEAVTIPEDAVPEFKSKTELRNWLIGKFNEIGNVTINSTGANVDFNRTAAQRAIKNARNRTNNISYPEIKNVVANAKYSGFRRTDERHQNVRGQDVYHSGVMYKGNPYSVTFYVDVPLEGNTGDNFAGNKISKIEIASADTQVTSENQNRLAQSHDAIPNISLAVLRGKVKPARYDASTSTYYQGKEVPIPPHEFYDDIKASPQYQDNIKYTEEVFDMVKADKHVVQASIDQSINRIGGQSTYIDGYFDNGVNFLIRISDHWSDYDLSHVSVSYGTDKNKILKALEYRRGSLDRAKEAKRQQHIAFTELLKKIIPESYYQYADSKESFKELAKQGVIERPDFMWGFNPEEQEKYGKLGIGWKDIDNFVKKKGDWAEEGVSSQASAVNDGVKASTEENVRPYSVRQVEKLLQNPQENEEVLLDLYDNHWDKYGASLKERIRAAVVYDLQKRDFKQTEEEKKEAKREAVKAEQANLKLPKKISLSALSKIIKDNGYPIVKQYTANTGSQYITVELDSATQDEIQISIRDHAKHSNDYVRPDYDLNIEYDNSWQEDFEKLADKLDLKGALVTKVKKYNELSRSLKSGEEQGEVYYQGQIADNAGAVELTINTAEEMAGVSEDEFKQKMLDTLKSFKGNRIFNQSLGGEIEIRTSSIKKYKSFFADKNKRLIVPYIPELLAKARFVSENTYTPATESNIIAYWKADLPINIDSDVYNVHLTVKQDNNGNFFWDAQVQEKAPRTTPATNPGDKGLKAEQSAYKDSISLEKKEVNKSFYQIPSQYKPELIVQHATTLEKLEAALDLGAMPMPSLAITKAKFADHSNFGEVIFLGGAGVINPQRNQNNRVFTADIYSTRKVQADHDVNDAGREYINRITGNISKKGVYYWLANVEENLNNGNDNTLKELYLASKGVITDLDGSTYMTVQNMTDKQRADFRKWKRNFINEYIDKRIFEGFNNAGNRKYSAYDLNNILRIMKKENLRGSESISYGSIHALRGMWAEELQTLEDIRQKKDKIVDPETYYRMDIAIQDETEKLVNELMTEETAKELKSEYTAEDDYVIEEVLKAIKPKSNIAALLKKAGLKSDKQAVEAVKKYMQLLQATPVQYFEAKPQRAVDFSEFAGVLLPQDHDYDDVANRLKNAGVERIYRYNSVTERADMVQRFNDVFFQRAWHGGADFIKFSLKYAGKATGQEHGYGVYATALRKVATRYRNAIDADFTYKGRSLTDLYNDLMRQNDYDKLTIIEDLLIKHDAAALEKDLYDPAAWRWFNETIKPELKSKGKLYELEVPENMFLIEENKTFSEQNDSVKNNLLQAAKEIKGYGLLKKAIKDNAAGYDLYHAFGKDVFADSKGYEGGTTETTQMASEKLQNYNIKGIAYDDKDDGRCFVIFNPDDVKILEKFYQTGELGLEGGRGKAPFGAQEQSRKEKVIYQVFGQYEPAKKLITLFQGKNSTTLVHELLHHYLPIYLTELEKAGKFEQLKGLYEALGVQSYSDIARQRAKMEQLIDLGTSYIYYNESPNEASRSLFERAKQWMLDAYGIVKKFVKPSKEVDAFFNELFAREEENLPDIRDLKGKSAELAKILKGAASGQELTVNGLSLRDIANLRKTLYARIPRAGESLADAIRQAGGIDTESGLAKALGYDSRKGSDMGFWNYKGAINDESSLIDFLTANGYLNQTESQSYDDTSAIWDKVEKLINDRNSVYNEKNQRQQEYRENALSAQKLVSEILTEHYIGDVKKLEEDLRGATKLLADKGGVAVDKLTLEYLARSVEQMDKKYRKLLYQKKEKGYNYRNQLNAYIEEMPLDFKHKSWLKALIKNVSDENSFNRELAKIKERGEKYIDQEAKGLYDNVIQDEVKSSRPKKVMQQKYDYENNKLFKDLREWNKMTQEQATAALVQFGEPENRIDLLRRMFLEYKANGKSSSVELMKQLSEMIKEAKQSGIEAKNESDFMKSFNREQAREEILKKLDASEADKNKLTTKIANAYRKLGTNLYSMLNSIAGKDVAEKYEMETVFDRKEQKEHSHIKKINQKAMEIYKVKSYGDFLNLVVDKGVKIDKLFRRVIDENMAPEQMDVENYDANMGYDVSILDIIDIYNAIKNKKTAEDYYKSYGAEQINRLLNLLSEEDKAFGDLMMADVNSRFKALNEVYVRLYGMDLKKVEDYWMGSAEHNKPVDIYNDFQMQGTTPGFFKERVSRAVVPVAKNAWLKYQKHISQSYYMTEIAEKYKELADIFNSNRIETRINNHFGEDVYHALRQQISALGLNAQSSELDDVSGAFQKMLNGWVGAKISVNPIVFVGQLTSFTNYAEGVNTSDFIKNIGYALLHPKQAFDFMIKYNGDFIKHRYEAGYNEAMTSFIAQAQTASKSKYGVSAKTKFNYTNALSSFVRTGDIGAIIFGGYGQFKTMLDSGMSLEEAQKAFEFSTLRSQQSGNAASLSKFQQSKGFSRLFLSFKNTSQQYMRKIADTVIMLQNGDISKAEGTKILTNYLLIQPALWVFAKNVAKALLGLDDDDDKLTDGILEQILVNPIDAIPLLNDIIKATYKKASGEKVHQVFSTPLFDDLEKSWRKAWKEDKTMFDYADVIAPFIEMTTSAPVGTAKRYVKALSDKWGE